MFPLLQAPAAAPILSDSVKVAEDVSKHINTVDSAKTALRSSMDSISNIQDVGAIVTGENPVLRNAINAIVNLTVGFIPKLIGALLVLWIGLKLIKVLKKAMIRAFDRRNSDASLKTFLASFVDVLLKILLIIMVMDIIGIKATSFIAILGAAGLAVGMALQGTLQNFAGGVIILMMKPFRVGDYVECGSYKGYVKEIRIFQTFIRPFNGRTIIVPNSELATKSLINHTHEAKIRLDVTVGVAYGSNPAEVKRVLFDVIKSYQERKGVDNIPLILNEEGFIPKIALSELNSSSVDFSVWMWCTVDNYWTTWMTIREDIYNALNAAHIEIPFPQVQLNINKENGANLNTKSPF
jgi:small conductance mechanosensitive channel